MSCTSVDTIVAFETLVQSPERLLDSPGQDGQERTRSLAAKFEIRFARSERSLAVAGELLGRQYAGRGYPAPKMSPGPCRSTILVYFEDRVIATMTVGYDPCPRPPGSPGGLLADEVYGEELDELRGQDRRLGELSKFAIDRRLGLKRSVLGGIFHVAFLYGVLHLCTDAVIEVTPEHAGFYQALLGFRQRGPVRLNPRVNTGGVLLHLELETMRQRIAAVAGKKDAAGDRSLYPWFFSNLDQDRLLRRILHATSLKE